MRRQVWDGDAQEHEVGRTARRGGHSPDGAARCSGHADAGGLAQGADPCAALRLRVQTRDDAAAAVSAEVAALRIRGVAWPAIGRALGVSRQAGRQRFNSAAQSDG